MLEDVGFNRTDSNGAYNNAIVAFYDVAVQYFNVYVGVLISVHKPKQYVMHQIIYVCNENEDIPISFL